MVANPGGRQRATPQEREAKRLLREGTIKAAKKLLALIDSTDERMAFAAAVAVLGHSEVSRVVDEGETFTAEFVADLEVSIARWKAQQNGSGE
jgi:hypothetical protein